MSKTTQTYAGMNKENWRIKQSMEGTNVSDLVNDVLRDWKKTADPGGWQTLVRP